MQGMAPRTNFQLARIFGIRIGVGISWFVVLFIFIYAVTQPFHEMLGGSRTTAYLVAVASVLSFFISVILHELGHALVARRNGLTVEGIDLWAFGGITRASESKSPGMEFRVALAGPLVTLGVILLCILTGILLSRNFFDVAVASGGVHAAPALVWLSWVATINALVLVFNLIPAFPLDGGRIAHAAIWRGTGDRNRATHITGRTGQAFAVLLGIFGLLAAVGGQAGFLGLFTIGLAFILYQAAGAAVMQGSLGRRIQNITVADVMDREPVTIPAGLSLLDAQERFFMRYRWPWFAVVDPARHFLGVVRGARVDAEISAGRPALPVTEVLEEDMPIRIGEQAPLESLLGAEGLGRLGAMVAVDEEGVLKGVVTLADVRKVLRLAT
jgi:Zn-dependent protease/CBS domain-containing protein